MDAFNSRFRRFRRLARDALWVAVITAVVVGAVTLLNLAPIGASGAARLADVDVSAGAAA